MIVRYKDEPGVRADKELKSRTGDGRSVTITGGLEKMLSNLNVTNRYYPPAESVIIPDIITELLVETQGGEEAIDQFKRQLDAAIFNGAENFGGIIQVTPLQNGLTSILIMLEAGRLSELTMRLSIIPGVEVYNDSLFSTWESCKDDAPSREKRNPVRVPAVKCVRIKVG